MDRQSYEDGRTGQASGPNTNMDAYRAGQREADAGTYKAGWEGEGNSSSGGGGGGVVSSVGTTNFPIGLIILAPSMFMTYPAGGILALVILGAACKLLEVVHVPVLLMALICFVGAFPVFFFAIGVEKKASRNGAYRAFRQVWRVVFCGMAIFAGTFINRLGIEKQRINLDLIQKNLDTAGGALVWTVIMMAGLFWLLGKADRIYFPPTGVWEKDPQGEAPAKAEAKARASKPRSAMARILMSVVWLVPVFFVAHLVLRLLVDAYFGSTASDSAAEDVRRAFYQKNMMYLYMADMAVWLVLSVAGLLPGTGRKK